MTWCSATRAAERDCSSWLTRPEHAHGRARPLRPSRTHADAIVLAIHWTRVDDVLAQAGKLSGATVLTCSLPMSKDDTHLVLGLPTSGAEALAAKAPGAHVVSAFSTALSEVLFPVFEGRGRGTPPDLVYCGDHKGAKKTAATLIRDVGFNPVDLGALSAARYVEPFSLLVAQIAYTVRGARNLRIASNSFQREVCHSRTRSHRISTRSSSTTAISGRFVSIFRARRPT